ncbi:MAG: DUF427 domain-containing protein [Alphaproteobacteria bacterium]|nr:DUF427 domain-containing protein [Alphaproteobacteria bacterium]
MTRQCLDRGITVRRHSGRVRVRFAGRTIVDTDAALALAEGDHPIVYYVPREAVDADILVHSAHTSTCPFKGHASYHHLRKGEDLIENAAWFYSDPCPELEAIRDHVAFRGIDVQVEAD